MRIAVVTRIIPWHAAGGMQQVSWDLMSAWADLGVDVHCLTTPVGGAPTSLGAVTVTTLPGRPGRYSRSWWAGTTSALRRLEPDVIFGVSAGAHAAVREEWSVPVVMQAHGTAMDEARTKLQVRSVRSLATLPRDASGLARDLRLYRRYSAVVAVGPAVASSLARYPIALRPREVVVIENGVRDPPGGLPPRSDVRRQFDVSNQAPVLLAIGRLHPDKAIHHVLEALRYWPGTLLVAGRGPAERALRSQAQRIGVAGRVRFLGWLDRGEVHAVLAAADAVVIPSERREGLPTVVLEALAHGTPVVASATAWLALPLDLKAMVHPTPLEPLALASSIEAAANQMQRPRLPDNYRLSTSAQRYLDFFTKLMEDRLW